MEKDFVEKVQRKIEAGEIPRYDCIIIPGSLSAYHYILLIKALKPKFIYFLFTREGEQNFEKFADKVGLKGFEYKMDVIEYKSMDIAEVYEAIKRRFELFEGKKVALDLTKGKKVMSVGAGIVAAFFDFDLVYIDEDWISELDRGCPGTEEIVRVKNPFEVFGDMKQAQGIMLFNRYDYDAASAIFNQLCQKVMDPREFEVKALVSEAYNYWDMFNYQAAHAKLEKALSKIDQYKLKKYDVQSIRRNLAILSILKRGSVTSISEFLNDDDAALHLIIDLYFNAQRRGELMRMEDAITRFYRCIEFVSQYRLVKYGLDTKKPDYRKMPEIREKYMDLSKKLYGSEKDLPEEIGIKDGHMILFVLQDAIWKSKSLEDLKKFMDPIRLRDNSIIAHGIELIGSRAFANIEKACKSLILKLCELQKRDFGEIVKGHQFMKFE